MRRFVIVPVLAVVGLLLGALTGCSGSDKPPQMQGGQKVDFHDAPVKPAGGGGGGGGAPGKAGGSAGSI